MLLNIIEVCNAAMEAGFRPRIYEGYAEFYDPSDEGPEAINWYGSVYTTAFTTISDSPPENEGITTVRHKGMCRSSDYGIQKLRERGVKI